MPDIVLELPSTERKMSVAAEIALERVCTRAHRNGNIEINGTAIIKSLYPTVSIETPYTDSMYPI